MDTCACGILRARAIIIEKVNSAVEIVLPAGVFITTMPRLVAASTSTLSTPTPARPTTRSLGALAITSVVILVADRTTMPSASASNSSVKPPSTTQTSSSGQASRKATPLAETLSQTSTRIGGAVYGWRGAVSNHALNSASNRSTGRPTTLVSEPCSASIIHSPFSCTAYAPALSSTGTALR